MKTITGLGLPLSLISVVGEKEEEKVVEKAEGLIRGQTEGDGQKCNF